MPSALQTKAQKKEDALYTIQMSTMVSPKKHKAELATAPPEKRLESPKISVDSPSVDAPSDDAPNAVGFRECIW